MKYSIYDLTTGRIDKVISCPESLLQYQYNSNTQGVINEYLQDDQFFVDSNGTPQQIPIKPSENHIFDYTLKQWVDPRTPATEWPIVRAERDRSLQASDWTQLPDVPLATKEAWAAHRQALRDVTLQPDPFNIVWPTPPN